MPLYRLTCTATATIEERWEVRADSPAEALEALDNGSADFIGETVLGDEENRITTRIEDMDTDTMIAEDEEAVDKIIREAEEA